MILAVQSAYGLQTAECVETEKDLAASTQHEKITLKRNGYGTYTILVSKTSGHYMYHQFNINQFYVLPTQLYLCVLCGSENKQRLFHCIALTGWFL